VSKAPYVLKLSTAGAVAALALSYGAAVALDSIGLSPVQGRSAETRPSESIELSQAESPISTGSLGDPRLESFESDDKNALLSAPMGEGVQPDAADAAPLVDYGAGLAKAGTLTMPAASTELNDAPAADAPLAPSPLRNVELLETAKPKSPLIPEERIIEIGPKKSGDKAEPAAEPTDEALKPKPKARKAAKKKRRKTVDPVLSFFGIE
jgi:hypothetical protein